jgi:hypothetical protein
MANLSTREIGGVNCTVIGAPLTNAQIDNNFIALNVDIATLQSYYVAGVEKIANGGTGASTAAQAKINLSIITSATGSQILPTGTTGERDAGNHAGYIRFNTTTGEFEGNNGSAWASVGGSAISNDITTATNIYPICTAATSGTAANVYTSNAKYLYKPSTGELTSPAISASNGLMMNSGTINTNYTITTGNKAMSVGPITLVSGKTITLSPNCRWIIL